MHKAGHGKYSVNSAYLFSTPRANILRAYDQYEIVSHNSPVASFCSNLVEHFSCCVPIRECHFPNLYHSSSCLSFKTRLKFPPPWSFWCPFHPPRGLFFLWVSAALGRKLPFGHLTIACLNQAVAFLPRVCEWELLPMAKKLLKSQET